MADLGELKLNLDNGTGIRYTVRVKIPSMKQ